MKKHITISLLLVVVDILSKFTIQLKMVYGQSINILGSFLRFTYVENKGVAFGFFSNHFAQWFYIKNLVLSFISLILIVFIFFEMKKENNRFKAICFSLIFGGALGNFLERIFGNIFYSFQFSIPFGKVVDFVDIGFGNYRWFIFNFADSFISIGLVLLLIHTVFYKIAPQD